MELAQELLEITNEAELEEFLGKLVRRVARGASAFMRSGVGKAVGGVLRNVAKTALPMVGSALGSFVAPGHRHRDRRQARVDGGQAPRGRGARVDGRGRGGAGGRAAVRALGRRDRAQRACARRTASRRGPWPARPPSPRRGGTRPACCVRPYGAGQARWRGRRRGGARGTGATGATASRTRGTAASARAARRRSRPGGDAGGGYDGGSGGGFGGGGFDDVDAARGSRSRTRCSSRSSRGRPRVVRGIRGSPCGERGPDPSGGGRWYRRGQPHRPRRGVGHRHGPGPGRAGRCSRWRHGGCSPGSTRSGPWPSTRRWSRPRPCRPGPASTSSGSCTRGGGCCGSRSTSTWAGWRAPGDTAPPAEQQYRFVLIRMRFNAILSQFDMFTEVVTQRSESRTGVWLAGLDALAADALTVTPWIPEPPSVVCYLARGAGAAIRRARTRLPGGDLSPVAIIRIPRERMVGHGIASSLVHEVGHQGAALLGLVDSLRADLARRAPRSGVRAAVWRTFDKWVSEIVADLWSVATLGISSTLGLLAVVSLPRFFVFRPSGRRSTPVPYIRVLISCALRERALPAPPVAGHGRDLEGAVPRRPAPGRPSRGVRAARGRGRPVRPGVPRPPVADPRRRQPARVLPDRGASARAPARAAPRLARGPRRHGAPAAEPGLRRRRPEPGRRPHLTRGRELLIGSLLRAWALRRALAAPEHVLSRPAARRVA